MSTKRGSEKKSKEKHDRTDYKKKGKEGLEKKRKSTFFKL
jgi:hypothetical protein